jgi:hypothetical protein
VPTPGASRDAERARSLFSGPLFEAGALVAGVLATGVLGPDEGVVDRRGVLGRGGMV